MEVANPAVFWRRSRRVLVPSVWLQEVAGAVEWVMGEAKDAKKTNAINETHGPSYPERNQKPIQQGWQRERVIA